MAKKKNSFLPIDFKTTEEIEVPERLIDQVIGQEHVKEIAKKAVTQHRHLLLIGLPGTGKSMIAKSMAELLPVRELNDIVVAPNPEDETQPKILVFPKGEGKKFIETQRKIKASLAKSRESETKKVFVLFLLSIISVVILSPYIGKDLAIMLMIVSAILFMTYILFIKGPMEFVRTDLNLPVLLIDNSKREKAPFIEATGATPSSLLGDVAHDPYQAGPMRIPPHRRVIPGLIHKAHKGVLFIDEIGSLPLEVQEQLLTAIQEKKYPIYGKHQGSAGSIIRTEPVPCDFILVIAGTVQDIARIHPALRSRIRGEGYEVLMKEYVDDTPENRIKFVQFVAQEVKRDGRIPHFTREAVEEIVKEAQYRAGKKGKLTLRLRDLSGLVKLAGDIAREKGHKYVEREDVLEAKKYAKPILQQNIEEHMKDFLNYFPIKTSEDAIGKVNGLSVFVDEFGTPIVGLPLIIEVEVYGPLKSGKGRIIATGSLGKTAKESVLDMASLISKITGKDISMYNINIQFVTGTSMGGVDGNSAGAAITVAVISALTNIPIRQDFGITGAISIRGEILPVGGVSKKIEGGFNAGLRKFIIPKKNLDDIVLPKEILDQIEIYPVETIYDVLKIVLTRDIEF